MRMLPFWVNFKTVTAMLVVTTFLIYDRFFSEGSKRRGEEMQIQKSIDDKPKMLDARLARFADEEVSGEVEGGEDDEDEDDALNSKPSTKAIGSALARETAQEEQKRRIEERIEKIRNTPKKVKPSLIDNSVGGVDGEEDEML